MRLNHDCVRSLMLYLEEHLSINDKIKTSDIVLQDFNDETVLYTAIKLTEAKYLKAAITDDVTGRIFVVVCSITWEGHKFLDTIRDPKIWRTTKGFLEKLSSVSITLVSSVASQVLTNFVNQYLAGSIQPL